MPKKTSFETGDRNVFAEDGTPLLVDFSPAPQPVAPEQPVVPQDPKDESVQEPADSKEESTPTTSSSPADKQPSKTSPPASPAQPGVSEGTTKGKASETSKPTS